VSLVRLASSFWSSPMIFTHSVFLSASIVSPYTPSSTLRYATNVHSPQSHFFSSFIKLISFKRSHFSTPQVSRLPPTLVFPFFFPALHDCGFAFFAAKAYQSTTAFPSASGFSLNPKRHVGRRSVRRSLACLLSTYPASRMPHIVLFFFFY